MTILAELNSVFVRPKGPPTQTAPKPGDKAPTSSTLQLTSGKPSIVVFLRHCGCPFSEKTYLDLRKAAITNPEIDFITVSHSDDAATNKWLKQIPQPEKGAEESNLRMVVDADKEAYAAWGLGAVGIGHVVNWKSFTAVLTLSTKGGISARGTDSGSRWQTSGYYAVDREGVVKYGRPAERADDMIDIKQALESVGVQRVNV